MPIERVRALLPGGGIVWVEADTANVADSESEVALDLSKILSLDDVSKVIGGLARLVHAGIEETKPRKITAEFSLAVTVESGQLTALWVKGSGNASIKLTLEWS
jgi:hypothetical protein